MGFLIFFRHFDTCLCCIFFFFCLLSCIMNIDVWRNFYTQSCLVLISSSWDIFKNHTKQIEAQKHHNKNWFILHNSNNIILYYFYFFLYVYWLICFIKILFYSNDDCLSLTYLRNTIIILLNILHTFVNINFNMCDLHI